jgi:hypothetical protein
MTPGCSEVSVPNSSGGLSREFRPVNCNDFTRAFLPRRAEMQERWAAIDRLAVTRDLPPVELYKVGDAYFIADGHHRVSVARRAGWRTIMAHVREYHTRVPLESAPQFDFWARFPILSNHLHPSHLSSSYHSGLKLKEQVLFPRTARLECPPTFPRTTRFDPVADSSILRQRCKTIQKRQKTDR